MSAACLAPSTQPCEVDDACLQDEFSVSLCLECVDTPRVCQFPYVFRAWQTRIAEHDELRARFRVEPTPDPSVKALATATKIYHCGEHFQRIEGTWFHSPDENTIIPIIETSADPPEVLDQGGETKHHDFVTPLNDGYAFVNLQQGELVFFDSELIPTRRYEHPKPLVSVVFAETRNVVWLADENETIIYDFDREEVLDRHPATTSRVTVIQDVFHGRMGRERLAWSTETGFEETKTNLLAVSQSTAYEDGVFRKKATGPIVFDMFKSKRVSRPETWTTRVHNKTPERESQCSFDKPWTVFAHKNGFHLKHQYDVWRWDGRSPDLVSEKKLILGVIDSKPVFHDRDLEPIRSWAEMFLVTRMDIQETDDEIVVKTRFEIDVRKIGEDYMFGAGYVGTYRNGEIVKTEGLPEGFVAGLSPDGTWTMILDSKHTFANVYNLKTGKTLKKTIVWGETGNYFFDHYIWSCDKEIRVFDPTAEQMTEIKTDVPCISNPAQMADGSILVFTDKAMLFKPDGTHISDLQLPTVAWIENGEAVYFHNGVAYRVALP